jgi:multiple sugar transport system permease protein
VELLIRRQQTGFARRPERLSTGWAQWREALPFVLPTILGLAIFNFGPVVASLFISFTQWNVFTPPTWVGAHNYQNLAASPLFWQVMGNTIEFTVVSVVASVALGLLVALALDRKLPGRNLLRSMYFSPVIVSYVAAGIIWNLLYQAQFGVINYLLGVIHIPGPAWLEDTRSAMPAMIIVNIWKNIGYNMVIFLAGLQGVPSELREAARVDGAGVLRQFWSITLPLISPTTFFVLVITTINSFQVFDQTYVMTQGGPANSTLTLAYQVYQLGFQNIQFGTAAAYAYVLFGFVLLITIIQFLFERRLVFYS